MSIDSVLQTPVSYGLIAAILVVSLYGFAADSRAIDRGSLHVRRVLRQREYYRLFTSGLLHGDGAHLLFNLITLYFFGPPLEAMLGSVQFLLLYLGAELAANTLTVFVQRNNLTYSSLGASGAISGVLMAFCLFRPFAEIYILFFPIGVPAFIYAAAYIAYSTFAMDSGRSGGIAHEAHLGGALGGIAMALLLRPDAISIFLGHFA
jgi:membrane associated rhomboid family serine protease